LTEDINDTWTVEGSSIELIGGVQPYSCEYVIIIFVMGGEHKRVSHAWRLFEVEIDWAVNLHVMARRIYLLI